MSKKTTMTVHGVIITEDQIAACENRMKAAPFTIRELVLYAESFGVPKNGASGPPFYNHHGVSVRFADRLIQRHSGRNIKYTGTPPKWHWVGQTQEERKA
jgi:hypothetical protein